MPLADECQAIAARISALVADLDAARSASRALEPTPRWTSGFGGLVAIGDQLATATTDLEACLLAHPTPLEVEIEIFDTTGPASGARSATLWRLAGASATSIVTEPVADGHAILGSAPDGMVGLTVERAGAPATNGIEFRSGWLAVLPRKDLIDPIIRAEILIAPTTTFAQADLDAAIATIGFPQTSVTPIGSFGGTATTVLESASVHLEPQRLRVRASGTVEVSAVGTSASAPWTAEMLLEAHLVKSPDAGTVVGLTVTGSPTVEVSGPFGALLDSIRQLLQEFVARQAADGIAASVNANVPVALARSFGLHVLPPGVTWSALALAVETTGITIEPTLGAFGRGISTFVP
jgi:hypothetical protein